MNRPMRGEPGGVRPKPKSRDQEARDFFRMIQPNWICPGSDVESMRNRMVKIANRSKDHRAAVNAASFLFNAEASVIQSAIAIYAAQNDQGAEAENTDTTEAGHSEQPGV